MEPAGGHYTEINDDLIQSQEISTDREIEVPYTICYAYDKLKERNYSEFMNNIKTYMRDENDIIFSKECFNEDPAKDNKYMIVIRKDINDQLIDNENFQIESNITLRRYKPKAQKINNSSEYGFFIKTDHISTEQIKNLFNILESRGFIHQSSYKFHTPQAYPDGSQRKYLIITFEKQDGSIPRGFVGKLKNLLNNSDVGGHKLKISWLQKNVLLDIVGGKSKKVFDNNDKRKRFTPRRITGQNSNM